MAPHRHMKCTLKVDTNSSEWEKSITKVIKRVKDVSYRIDTTRGCVHISGTINPEKILNDMRKAGKNAKIVHLDCGGNSHSHSHYNNGAYGYHGYNNGYGYSDPHRHSYHHYGYLQSPIPPMSYAYDHPYYATPSWSYM